MKSKRQVCGNSRRTPDGYHIGVRTEVSRDVITHHPHLPGRSVRQWRRHIGRHIISVHKDDGSPVCYYFYPAVHRPPLSGEATAEPHLLSGGRIRMRNPAREPSGRRCRPSARVRRQYSQHCGEDTKKPENAEREQRRECQRIVTNRRVVVIGFHNRNLFPFFRPPASCRRAVNISLSASV